MVAINFYRLFLILSTIPVIYRFEIAFALKSTISNSDHSIGGSVGSSVDVGSSSSSVVYGETDKESSTQESSGNDEISELSTVKSSDAVPEGESLIIGDSSFVSGGVSQHSAEFETMDRLREDEIEKESIQYGYDNIDDSTDYRLSPQLVKDEDYSSPVIMEPFDDKSSVSEQEKKELELMTKVGASELPLVEPPTEKVESSSVRTPVTEKVEESKEKSPETETHGKSEEQKMVMEPTLQESKVYDDSKSPTSDVVFEEVSESKLPKFAETLQNEEKNMFSNVNIIDSSLSSGISESIESSDTEWDSSKSDIIQVDETRVTDKNDSELAETKLPLSENTSKSHVTELRSFFEEKSSGSEPYDFIEKSKTQTTNSESSFVNPTTEEITLTEDLSTNYPPSKNFLNEEIDLKNTNDDLPLYKSETIEPPTPSSSFIEEKTVGNQRFYSGPYIKTNATAGKVSPRIASVIETLVGQFEKYNLYGSGSKNNASVSGSNVRNIKDSFEGLSDDNEAKAIQPINPAEEEYISSLKAQAPNNTFLYKNRYEEMRLTRNSFGKSLLQVELEKMRGILRETIGKQLKSGVLERSTNKINYSGIPIDVHSYNEHLKSNVGGTDNNINTPNSNPESSVQTDNLNLQNENPNLNTELSSEQHDYKFLNESGVIYQGNKLPIGDSKIEKSLIKTQTIGSGTENYTNVKAIEETPETTKSENTEAENERLDMNKVVDIPVENFEENYSNQKITIPKGNDSFGRMPFSYINGELPLDWKYGNARENTSRNRLNNIGQKNEAAFGNRKLEFIDQDDQYPENDREYNKNEASVSYSKEIELSPEEENEINQCYLKAKKIKTINFGLDVTANIRSPASETFINEVNKHKGKIRELVLFGQEAVRVAEKYNKKRSWRAKTKKFKLDFLESCYNFLKHTKAVKSLIYHISNASSRSIFDIIDKILQKHKHSKQSLLVQCKILDQAFFSRKNSIRGKLMRKISDMYFVDVINEQIGILIDERLNPLVNSIKSNKYTRKKLLKIIPSVDSLMVNKKGYPELSLTESETKKKSNKLVILLRKIFKKPSFLKSKKKNLKCVKGTNCCKKNK
ncbi:hypothetical protein FG379_000132 [Cryptosporidium bovis]|uniref:uncharacterized protein n=1 Tax=Cryptosporidium bovis TaxID=310047 RepID=UPI003519FE36|nr:hypothetical protein FG379_000132 [Cryptosporidium bovis]